MRYFSYKSQFSIKLNNSKVRQQSDFPELAIISGGLLLSSIRLNKKSWTFCGEQILSRSCPQYGSVWASLKPWFAVLKFEVYTEMKLYPIFE